ncbi:hypothetical protein [Rugosimonospora africana]|uniref:Uncharacterized protein n=1 Tax=Rugosimonospora africana TaxID=556532 RepID=A0A8J3R0W3_9ACTN|nr:hypothetical protein [Rugosimonospora africana]GIH19538.1 hypothetical protein Raf01_77100 [Rugosimonospora africana]
MKLSRLALARGGRLLTAACVIGFALTTPAAAAGPVTSTATAEVVAPPAGMHHYVVSVGRVVANEATAWVRLAQYTFNDDGTVSSTHWYWTHRRSFVRVSTGIKATGCPARDCYVRTADGFKSTTAPDALSGTYAVNGSALRITWDGGIWEDWTVSEPIAGKLGKLTFSASSYGQTAGWGYGSEAAWNTRVSVTQIASDAPPLRSDGYYWNNGSINHTVSTGFDHPWKVCTGNTCLSDEHTATACNPRASDGKPMIDYYLTLPYPGATDRRNALEHWCEANADGRGEYCYTGNSHIKPMLQIIDSDGRFHGWVGVEASPNETVPNQQSTLGIFVAADDM